MTTTHTHINNGHPTTVWNGLAQADFLRRAAQAGTADEAQALAHVASLMAAGEPITVAEFEAARAALYAVERGLVAAFVGPIRRNRHGQIHGGTHPALAA